MAGFHSNKNYFLPGLIVLFFIFLSSVSFACQCPLSRLSLEECNKYEIIFRGRIKSSTGCQDKKGAAVFEILELYKGNSKAEFTVLYECGVECAQEFNAGEEWIIYTRYKQIDNAKMDWCSRSRKYFKNEKSDFYAMTYGNSYDAELTFLRTKLGQHNLLKESPYKTGERNQLPTRTETVIMLIVSLVAIILFYYLFNKYFGK